MVKKNQNTVFVIGFTLIFLVIVWSLARPEILKWFQKNYKSDKSEEEINKEILRAPLITPKDLQEKIKNKEKIFLFDMRAKDEFEKGHLEKSENVPGDLLNLEKLDSLQLEKTSSIVLLNQGDDIYGLAKKTNEFIAAGYVNTKYLQGGISAWKNQGYPLISNNFSEAESKKIKKINISDLANTLSLKGDFIQLIDVRSREKFESEHIPGAINISLSELEKSQDKISPIKRIVIYGDKEEASRAAVTLFDLNFFNAYVLEGGLETWKSAGGQIATGG